MCAATLRGMYDRYACDFKHGTSDADMHNTIGAHVRSDPGEPTLLALLHIAHMSICCGLLYVFDRVCVHGRRIEHAVKYCSAHVACVVLGPKNSMHGTRA